jgi:hypothetical protein
VPGNIQKAPDTVAGRFTVLNGEIEQKTDALVAQRRDELNRAKNAL